MKNIIFTLGLIFFTSSLALGQKYYPVPALDKFVGSWTCSKNNATFKTIIVKNKIFVKNLNIFMDVLEGSYIYISNGEEITSKPNKDEPGLEGGAIVDKEKSLSKVHFLFNDEIKNKRGDVILEIIPEKVNELTWVLTNTEGVRVGDYDYKFSVPLNMIMKKVE